MEKVFQQYKELQIKKADEILKLILEKERIIKENSNDQFIDTKYTPFEKVFKRKQYKKYLETKETYEKEKETRTSNRSQRITEIDAVLKDKQRTTSKNMLDYCSSINGYTSFDDFNVTIDEALSELTSNNIEPTFDSYSEAFEYMPNYFGSNKDFMLGALDESFKYILYDKTNSDELYLKVLPEIIKCADKDEERQKILLEYIHELTEPKVVEEGRYKIPHKYMFEELKKYLVNPDTKFKYTELDGVFSEEYGKELEELYEDEEYFIGLHSTFANPEREQKIFYQGLRNSMQNANNALNRTVMYGDDLTFTRTLNYAGYALFSVEDKEHDYTNFILRIPYKALDPQDPLPIWCSNSYSGSENYLNPDYVYGMYHLRDGANRKIIHNDLQEKASYKYIKVDESIAFKIYEMEEVYQNNNVK